VEEEGAVTIQAKKFNEIISRLPTGDVNFVCANDAPETIKLSCGNAKYTLHGIPAADYPGADPFVEDWAFAIGGKDLIDALVKVVYARSDDESRKALNGILFSIRSGIRTVAATDGRRLALVEAPVAVAEGSDATEVRDGEFIMPYKVVAELIKSLDQSKSVVVHLTKAMAVFETGSTTIMSKLVEQTYPNYRSVIPVSFHHEVTIPRALFLDVLKRISPVIFDSGDTAGSVKLDIVEGNMTLSASSSEVGDANETIGIALKGDPISISFNPAYLSDPIKSLSCNEFVLKFNDAVTPVELTGDPGFIYILMPMRS
jgi:DNA polymerase-3 subunit beta